MKVITWNIWGMHSILKLDIFRKKICHQNPDIMVIQETKMEKEKAKSLKSFNIYTIMASSFEGASRSMLIMWNNSLFIGIFLDANKHFIVVKIHCLTQNKFWYLVNVYAPNNKKARKFFWEDYLS